MKYIFIVFILVLSFNNGYATDKDTTLIVKIENGDNNFKIYLTFENISNDTILLVSHFRVFDDEISQVPGFMLSFFRNQKEFRPYKDDIPLREYKFNEGKTTVNPKSKVQFEIDLKRHIGKIYPNDIYGIKLELNYRYFVISHIPTNRKYNFKCLKTNYLQIN